MPTLFDPLWLDASDLPALLAAEWSRPAMAALKLLLLIAACAIITVLIQFAMHTPDDISGAPHPPTLRDLQSTPVPPVLPGPVFR